MILKSVMGDEHGPLDVRQGLRAQFPSGGSEASSGLGIEACGLGIEACERWIKD